MPCSRTSNSISIHASAKEATLYHLYLSQQSEFQSTPPRRRRHPMFRPISCIKKFQSTPPRRRRLCSPSFSFFPKFISIHASAKEATGNILSVEKMKKFQSTPPRRRRQMLLFHLLYNFQFQSTPPRRRRPFFATPSAHFFISIHASAKEATIVFQFRYSNF